MIYLFVFLFEKDDIPQRLYSISPYRLLMSFVSDQEILFQISFSTELIEFLISSLNHLCHFILVN